MCVKEKERERGGKEREREGPRVIAAAEQWSGKRDPAPQCAAIRG